MPVRMIRLQMPSDEFCLYCRHIIICGGITFETLSTIVKNFTHKDNAMTNTDIVIINMYAFTALMIFKICIVDVENLLIWSYELLQLLSYNLLLFGRHIYSSCLFSMSTFCNLFNNLFLLGFLCFISFTLLARIACGLLLQIGVAWSVRLSVCVLVTNMTLCKKLKRSRYHFRQTPVAEQTICQMGRPGKYNGSSCVMRPVASIIAATCLNSFADSAFTFAP